jgi:5,10-methylene-tetrahydrofolate dehydrogenase/methenyl tetrahydrofolate cyclohydrolase
MKNFGNSCKNNFIYYMMIMSQRLLAQPALAAHHSYIDKHAHLLEGKFLAIIMVGTDPSSQTYVRMKQRLGLKHNIDTRIIELSESTTQASDITNLIHELNDDITCAGIMLQLPLPAALREHTINICALIDPSKDVDGLG